MIFTIQSFPFFDHSTPGIIYHPYLSAFPPFYLLGRCDITCPMSTMTMSLVIVLGGMPFSNAVAASLYEDYADGFGYQGKHERGTMQNKTINKIINAINDDPDSIDQVGIFLREKVDLVEMALGSKIIDSFLNLNRGQEKTPEQERSKGELAWWLV